jgi:taurine transport system permease protein
MSRPALPNPVRTGLLRAVSLGSILMLWWVLTDLDIWSRLILPHPSDVWHAFIQSVTTEGRRRGLFNFFLWEHLRASLWRIANGLLWAIVVGPPLGLLLASSRRVRIIVEPWISFLRSLPPLAYFSLLIIWFGIKDTSKIWLLFIAAFPPIVLATINGITRVDRSLVDAASSLGGGWLTRLRRVIVPMALPDIITGIRVASGFAWTTIVAAETSNGIPGIGGLAWATKKELRTDVAILCVIVIGITAVLIDQLLLLLERVLAPWRRADATRSPTPTTESVNT